MANIWRRIKKIHWERNIVIALMSCALISGIATYAVMRGYIQTDQQSRTITWLLTIDILLALGLLIAVIRRLVQLLIERKRGMAGARLHSRLVLNFALIGIVPTMIITLVSTAFLDYGLNVWFSDRIRKTIGSSLEVAQAYVIEHQKRIGNDAQIIADELQRYNLPDLLQAGLADDILARELRNRNLAEGVIIKSNRQILVRGGFSLSIELNPNIPDDAFLKAQSGGLVLLGTPERDRVRALVVLDPLNDYYLYVGRELDDQVMENVRENEDLVQLYQRLDSERSSQQISVAVIFAIVALLLLVVAVWFGLHLAGRLAKPISRLDRAARRLGRGDLSARVKIKGSVDEMRALSRAFNYMADQIQNQRQALIDASRQIDERRQFTELVLAGVSAGVIGLNENCEIDLPNRSASELLGEDLTQHLGEDLRKLVPQFAPILEQARQKPERVTEDEITVLIGDLNRTLHVRAVWRAGIGNKPVITFDDVSDLLAAQRKAAWADIARRIAHEIKNPLTPIQLSAERLKRKYLNQITEGPEIFVTCTDTIIRHVADIGRMVDEFSAFARMPAPVRKPEDQCQLAREILYLQQNANPDIEYRFEPENPPPILECDAAQFNRAVTNLLKNAAEAIEGRKEQGNMMPGFIRLSIKSEGDDVVVEVEDNGRGLPKTDRHKLTEPYVTTRAKGTGLGLAIVKKIMEDHNGRLGLEDSSQGGALVKLIFSKAGATVNVA